MILVICQNLISISKDIKSAVYTLSVSTIEPKLSFDIANFIKFDNNLTIDFENNNGEFKNILINTTDENEVLIYAVF